MRAFGTEEIGNRDGFKIICNKCGREARLVPTHHFKDDFKNPEKITLTCQCICGNKYTATIHSKR